MVWFILFIVAVWAVCAFLERASMLVAGVVQDRDRRRAVEALYREQCLGQLHAISSVLNGPNQPPLSRRIAEAERDVERRREVRQAMEKELGVR